MNTKEKISYIRRIVLVPIFLVLVIATAHAQVEITGPNCVISGQFYTYTLENLQSSFSYVISGGTLSTGGSSGNHSAGLVQLQISWKAGGGTISLFSGTGSPSLSVSTMSAALTPGSFASGQNQTLNSGQIPATITCNAPTGGSCSTPNYGYQWMQSTDNVNYANVASGGNSLSLFFTAALAQTMYYHLVITEKTTGNTATSAVATIIVYPPLVSGSITPGTQSINYNAVPGPLSVSNSTGGSGGYTYQWLSSSAINGAYNQVGTGSTYAPGQLISTTYYEVLTTTSNGAQVTSSPVVVNVYPQVVSVISPTGQTINYNTQPSGMSVSSTGGTGPYSYVWEAGPSSSGPFTQVGSGSSYDPPALAATTYYEVVTTNNGAQVTSTPVGIQVVGQTPPPPRSVPAAYTTANFSYVRTYDASAPDQDPIDLVSRPVSDVLQTTHYVDGLGRQLQTVVKGVTPAGNDMVTPVIYDNMGREQFKYLPFVSTGAQSGDITNDGNFKQDAFQQQAAFFTNTPILENQGELYFYSQTNYEPSPLSRVSGFLPPGNNWVGAGIGTQTQYMTNTGPDNVQQWAVTASFASIPNSTPPTPVNLGPYPGGTLYKAITIDEANNQVVTFTDIAGKTILRQVQSVAAPGTNHSGWLNTYYIYDDLGNLRYVVQPQAVQLLLNSNSWDLTSIPNLLTGLCFYYEYDQRNRMIIKQVPGAQSIYMVYDALDRLVMTQDGNQRSTGQWLVTVYENGHDRPIQSGLLTDPTTPLGTELSNAYNSTSYPSTTSGYQVLTQTFYDNYNWQAGTPVNSGFDASQASSAGFQPSSNTTYPYPRAVITTTYTLLGLVTGMQKAVLGQSGYLYTANYYDDRDRVIQTQNTNITGGVDETTSQYAFTGKVLVTQTRNIKNGSNPQTNTVQSQMSYDAGGRLASITKSITGSAGTITKQLVTSSYNEVGELSIKTLGPGSSITNGPIDQLTYDYNIRGWMLGIDRSYLNSATSIAITSAVPAPGNYFGEELAYDKMASVSGLSYIAPQLNGNIAGTVWKSTGDAVTRKYDFTYDQANRLTAGN